MGAWLWWPPCSKRSSRSFNTGGLYRFGSLPSVQKPGQPVSHLRSKDHEESRTPYPHQRPRKQLQGKQQVAASETRVAFYSPAMEPEVSLTVPLPLWVSMRPGETRPQGPNNPWAVTSRAHSQQGVLRSHRGARLTSTPQAVPHRRGSCTGRLFLQVRSLKIASQAGPWSSLDRWRTQYSELGPRANMK